MDNTETHYLTFDMDAIYMEMQAAYINAGGAALYPGDEKEMLLRGVGAIMAQAFAGVDNALRMSTLRYAVGDYLDLIGENRGCFRFREQRARSEVIILFTRGGPSGIIPAGAELTADGQTVYTLDESLSYDGNTWTAHAAISAKEAGAEGNGLSEGAVMRFFGAYPGVESVSCSVSAYGGSDQETDEQYRERIRTNPIMEMTAGPKQQYEALAKGVSERIVDANAVNTGAGQVTVYLLLKDSQSADELEDLVTRALNAENARPLTDTVTVSLAEDIPYVLDVNYVKPAGANLTEALNRAKAEYQAWQDNTIGREFNPDRLAALCYAAGCTRVIFGSSSHFNHGAVTYTPIGENQRCLGQIVFNEVI